MFSPSISGSIESTILITDNSVDGSHTIEVNGTGNETNVVTTSLPSLAFGSQANGSTSADQTVVIGNPGTTSFNIVDTNVTGGFALHTDQCTAMGSVAPGSSCSVSVSFTPSLVGPYNGYLTVADDVMGGTAVIVLTGTGADFQLLTNPNTQNISPGQTATYTLNITPQGGLTGIVQITCAGSPSESNCSVAPSSVTLDGVHAAQVAVSVTTTAGTSMAFFGGIRTFPSAASLPSVICFMIVAASLLALRNKPRRFGPGTALIFLSLAISASCGGSSSPPIPKGNPGTPPGQYTLTLSASAASGNLSHAASITMNVK